MCDDQTEAENALYLEEVAVNRRQLAMGATAAAAVALIGCGPKSGTQTPGEKTAGGSDGPADSGPDMPDGGLSERMVSVQTPDGVAEAFFVAPASGAHPGVLMWPDVAGLRDAFKAMARRLAEAGYAVLAVNPYYRSSQMPVLETFGDWRTDDGKAKIKPMIEALSAEGIASDGAAFVGWLDEQAQVDNERKVATIGYCMSGPFTFRMAAAVPDRVGVIGSFHGGGLVTEESDSPHTLLPQIKAAALVCIAENDDARDPETKTTLKGAAADAGVEAEIEVYSANHGWCVIDSPVYDQAEAERAWARMLVKFAEL